MRIVIQIITSPPVNAVLKVYSYLPRPQAKVLPMASLDQAVAVKPDFIGTLPRTRAGLRR